MCLLLRRFIDGTKAKERAVPAERLSEPLRSQILEKKKKRKRSVEAETSAAPTLHDFTKRA